MLSFLKYEVQNILNLFVSTVRICCFGPYRNKEVIKHMSIMGIESLPIIVIATAFAGLVVTSEISFHMDLALHTHDMIPGFSAQFIFRELGIAIPALLLVAKIGASTTAEVATMKITEQLDALKLLQIDIIDYIVYPRFIACIVITSCLTLISIFVTLSCGILYAVINHNYGVGEYLNNMVPFIGFFDIICALVKGAVFGAITPIISCYYGFQAKEGTESVGIATTNSVVASTVLIIVFDFLLTYFFSNIL